MKIDDPNYHSNYLRILELIDKLIDKNKTEHDVFFSTLISLQKENEELKKRIEMLENNNK